MRGERTRHWPGLLGVVLLALVVRGLLCVEPACTSPDGVHFVSYAKQLNDDPIRWMKGTTKQPGFSYLLLFTHRMFGEMFGGETPLAWQRCGELLALIGGVVVCGLIYGMTRWLFHDERISFVAGTLACFWPQGAHLSADVLSEMPHLALYLFAMWLAYEFLLRPRLWMAALCGVSIGIAYLIRQEALGLVVAAGLCWLWPLAKRPWRVKLIGVVILLTCFMVTVAPYSLAVGDIMPNKSPEGLMNQFFSQAMSLAPTAGILAHVIPKWMIPGRMAEEWSRSGRYVISTLFLIGLFLRKPAKYSSESHAVTSANRQGRMIVGTAVTIHLVLVLLRVVVYGDISSRYMVIPVALTIPWAAVAFVSLVTRIAQRIQDPTPARRAAVWLSGFLLVLTPLIYFVSLPVNRGSETYRAAGLWLQAHAKADDLVLANDRLGQIMFYAGRTYPETTWLKCRNSDTPTEIHKIILRRHPAWYVNAEMGHKDMKNESRYVQLAREIPELSLAYTTDAEQLQAYIFRVSATKESK